MEKKTKRVSLNRILIISICILAIMQLNNNICDERNVAYGLVDSKLGFVVSNGEATINAYGGTESILVIPAFVSDGTNTYPVTKIGAYAFMVNDNLVSVTIPEGVTEIGDSAFYECNNLSEVVFPNTLKSLGNNCFFRSELLQYFNLPDGLLTIGENCFSSKDLIVNIRIPDSVVSIGKSAFASCSNLSSVTLSANLKTLSGFNNCNSLTKIDIPESVTRIDDTCFAESNNLKDVVLPANLEYIGEYSFLNCTSLTEIKIPETVKSMGRECFSGCSGIAEITIPENVTYLGDESFTGCSNLSSVVLPSQLTNLGNGLFSGCRSLRSIIIPDGVATIGDNCFSGCSSLSFPAIPGSITKIGNYAFSQCGNITSVTIPDTVTQLGIGCFASAINLVDVTLSKNMTSISDYCFERCRSLTKINIPFGITRIGKAVFFRTIGAEDDALKLIVVPASVSYIDSLTFGSESLKAIYFLGDAPTLGTSTVSTDLSVQVYYLAGRNGYADPRYGSNPLPFNIAMHFESLGGSPVEPLTPEYNSLVEEPIPPVRAGYDFRGWYNEPSCLRQWDFQTRKMPVGEVTLFAGWEPHLYKVSLNGNGAGSGYMNVMNATYDVPTSIPSNQYVRNGYTFVGWANNPTGSVAYADRSNFINLTSVANAQIELYAVWKANSYNIKFDPNGGTSGVMSDISVSYDTMKALPANTLRKSGYAFQGWATSPTGAVVYKDMAPVMNLTATEDATVNLYAKWTPNTYIIKFNINGGSSGTVSSLAMTYDTAKSLTANSFKKTGYSFLGWATSSTGPVVYKDLASVKNLTATNGATINLYAKWGAPILSAASYNYNSIKVSWAAAGSATSYKIYRATSAAGTYTLVHTSLSTTRSWIDSGRVTGKTYCYKVYPVASGTSYKFSTYKSAKAVPATPTPTVIKTSTTSIKIAWNSISGAAGYQIYRATSATGTYGLLKTTSSTSYTNLGLTTGKTYYYKVRAYHIENGMRVYGSFSTPKNIVL